MLGRNGGASERARWRVDVPTAKEEPRIGGVGVKLGDVENTSTACKSERRKGRGGEGGVRTEGAML